MADSVYWMARYVERAENLARFIDVTLNFILDQPQGTRPQWEPLVNTTGDDALFAERYGAATEQNVIRFLIFDPEYENSLISSLKCARENARSVRESIPSEAFEQLNDFYHTVRALAREPRPRNPAEFFQSARQFGTVFNGLLDTTMLREEAWPFANLGRLLDVKYYTLLPGAGDVGTTLDDLQWSAVLRAFSGFEMYRKRHHGVTVQRVVAFMLLDQAFPRSMRFCVGGADASLRAISGSPPGTFRNDPERLLGRLLSELAYADAGSIIDGGFHEFIDRLQQSLNAVGDGVHQTFFALRPADPLPQSGPSQSQTQFPG